MAKLMALLLIAIILYWANQGEQTPQDLGFLIGAPVVLTYCFLRISVGQQVYGHFFVLFQDAGYLAARLQNADWTAIAISFSMIFCLLGLYTSRILWEKKQQPISS